VNPLYVETSQCHDLQSQQTSSSKASGLYPKSVRFKCRLGHRQSCLGLFVVLLSPASKHGDFTYKYATTTSVHISSNTLFTITHRLFVVLLSPASKHGYFTFKYSTTTSVHISSNTPFTITQSFDTVLCVTGCSGRRRSGKRQRGKKKT
jgi:hypothetical protein